MTWLLGGMRTGMSKVTRTAAYLMTALILIWAGYSQARRSGAQAAKTQIKQQQQEAEIKAHEKLQTAKRQLDSDDDVIDRLRRNGL